MVIQQLLAEAGSAGTGHDLVAVDPRGAEAPADWATLRSPENYTGYGAHRELRLARRRPCRASLTSTPSRPRLRLNDWALAGDWTMEEEAVHARTRPAAQIACRFQARDVNLVMGPAAPGTPVRFRVLIDGQPPGADHGTDVDENGSGTLSEQRLYQLVRQHGHVTERTFEITFLDPGAAAYSFTFG